MTRSAVRRLAPAAALALALLAGGCGSDNSTGATGATGSTGAPAGDSPAASAAPSASAALCDGFAKLKTDAADLTSNPVRTDVTTEEVQQQLDALSAKADKVRDDLSTMMMESNGGPAAAAIGALNKKADAFKAQLAATNADAEEDIVPKITAAQSEISTALAPVTAAVGALCPSS